MTDKKKTWGGARPGAGRKPSPVKRTAVSIYLTPDQRAAYDALRARGVDVGAVVGRELKRRAIIEAPESIKAIEAAKIAPGTT